MPSKRQCLMVIVGCLLALPGACKRSGGLGMGAKSPAKTVPAGVAGTIAQYASVVGDHEMLVRGYGLVVGLGDAGSAEVPPAIRRYLTRLMVRHKIGSATAGLAHVTPARILEDKDTAVVMVWGWIPPGATPKTRFDVFVETLPGTQTLSLDGGVLMSAELRLALSASPAAIGDRNALAMAHGAIFVNPFIERGKDAERAKMRIGRIPNGGMVQRPRSVRLELRQGDFLQASVIQRRINQRFGSGTKPANARGSALIELAVPARYVRDYGRFRDLVTHLFIEGGPAEQDRYARQLARAILLPTARYEDIALAWEAMGRQVVPVIRPLYASANSGAAYYAARTGLRLGDGLAVDPMIRMALKANSPFQIPAVGELGQARQFIQAVPTLKRMLSSPDAMLRVAAYEALVAHGSTAAVRRQTIGDRFILDVVDSPRNYTIYATSTGRPKIVLFGTKAPIHLPVFYRSGDGLVTINADRRAKKIMVYRRVPGAARRRSEEFYIAPQVEDLVKTLGAPAAMDVTGKIEGLDLKYSQVLSVLYALCRAGHVPAKFVLQRSSEIRRIYGSKSAGGRPDTPEGPE